MDELKTAQLWRLAVGAERDGTRLEVHVRSGQTHSGKVARASNTQLVLDTRSGQRVLPFEDIVEVNMWIQFPGSPC